MPAHSKMCEVHISQEGIVKNILSLNYNDQTMVKEYLNNVLAKNNHLDYYSITFNLKDISPRDFMFEFVEENARGFESLEEIRSAFAIADSERRGVNNMGYGIYSPITTHKDRNTYGFFIQHNENGSFYSIVRFNSELSTIHTIQGEFDGTTVLGHDVSSLLVPGGTRSVWISNNDEITEGADIIREIKKHHRKSITIDNKGSDTKDAIMELSKYYNHYLVKGVKIHYGDDRLLPNDILKADDGKNKCEKKYEISVSHYDGRYNYRIREESVDGLRNFTKDSKKPLGEEAERRNRCRTSVATVAIHDIDTPNTRVSQQSRKDDRKMWVKINNTYIFCEDFPLKDHPNIRVVITINNEGDNCLDGIISPDANKSNSKIKQEIKDRISGLVKYTINGERGKEFYGSDRITSRVHVHSKIKHDVWERVMDTGGSGYGCRGTCTQPECNTVMTAWMHDLTRINDAGDDSLDNLRPICNPCGKKLV